MKTILKSTAVISALLVTVSATAGTTKGQALTDCKTMINAEFENVKRIKLANLKDRRGKVIAKFRVSADGENASYTCTVERDAAPLLVRTDKPTQDVAGGQ